VTWAFNTTETFSSPARRETLRCVCARRSDGRVRRVDAPLRAGRRTRCAPFEPGRGTFWRWYFGRGTFWRYFYRYFGRGTFGDYRYFGRGTFGVYRYFRGTTGTLAEVHFGGTLVEVLWQRDFRGDYPWAEVLSGATGTLRRGTFGTLPVLWRTTGTLTRYLRGGTLFGR
jgi:hypothetical protein